MRQINPIIVLLILVPIISACEKKAKVINDPEMSIDTKYYEMELYVEDTDLAGFQIFAEEAFTSEMDSLLTLGGLTTDDLKRIRIKEATIDLVDSENYSNFDMLSFIELTIYTDDLGELEVAWSDPLPVQSSMVLLDVTEENLLPYFSEGEFLITAQGYLKQRVTGTVTLRARISFTITVKL
jgi:hypothetical protein